MSKKSYSLATISLLILLLTVISASALTVTLTADQTSGDEPLAVEFTCSVADGNATYDYYIDFGDGSDSKIKASS